jgi:alpha-beta hydrolase superfamily lysophospholipase
MPKESSGEIIYKRWVAPSPRAVFLLVHGLGAHAGRWETAAEDFLKNGISSYAVELKEPVGPGWRAPSSR